MASKTVTNDQNHQGVRRIFGVVTPRRGDEAVNKWYCDQNSAGATAFLDGGRPDTDFSDGPLINCGGIT